MKTLLPLLFIILLFGCVPEKKHDHSRIVTNHTNRIIETSGFGIGRSVETKITVKYVHYVRYVDGCIITYED